MPFNGKVQLLFLGVLLLFWYHHMEKRRRMSINACRCNHALAAPPQSLDPAYPLTAGMYPLRHPLFCAREAAKNMVLLEDHFIDPHRRCPDCAKKHLLLVEGFLEEGLLMDRHHKYSDVLLPALDNIRVVVKRFNDGVDPVVLAQSIRDIRKPLTDQSFEYFQQ